MRRWRQWIMAETLVLVLAGLTGCGGDDGGAAGTGGDSALAGNWRMTSMSVNGSSFFPPAQIGWDVQFQLSEDGSVHATEVWQGKTESGGGDWSTTGNQLHIEAGGYDWLGPYTVSARQFTLSNVPNYDGEDDTGSFVFARQ